MRHQVKVVAQQSGWDLDTFVGKVFACLEVRLSRVGQTKRIVWTSVDANSKASSTSSPLERNSHNKCTNYGPNFIREIRMANN